MRCFTLLDRVGDYTKKVQSSKLNRQPAMTPVIRCDRLVTSQIKNKPNPTIDKTLKLSILFGARSLYTNKQ